jgi:stage V sporulation protein SpoVS
MGLSLEIIACGGSPTQAVVSSPTPDSVAGNYVALVRNFWIEIQAADEVSIGNVAARACAGQSTFGAPTNMQLIDPPTCRERAVALLAAQQKFLSDLDTTPAPPTFAIDDQTFRSQLPKTIADLKALIAAADTGSKDAVLQATTTFLSDMIPTVTGALDHVDPSVLHS